MAIDFTIHIRRPCANVTYLLRSSCMWFDVPCVCAQREYDGHYWFTGRVKDLCNVSGYRIRTAEVEAGIVMAENAVVDVNHLVKSHFVYTYVTLLLKHADGLESEIIVEAGKKERVELKKGVGYPPGASQKNR